MSETLAYIDQYFNNELSPAEKLVFEKRCESDQAFADEVAFYVSSRASAEAEADLQMKKRFDQLYFERRSNTRVRSISRFSFISIAAAASVILFLGWFFLLNPPSATQLADRYIQEHFQTISPSLSNTKDSIELGKNAFNNKNYPVAEKIFIALSGESNVRAEAIEYLGILYLATARYDEAIVQFEKLSRDTTLQVNYGSFYESIALIKRNREGDHAKAKLILQAINTNGLAGRKEAAEWIKGL